MLTELKSSRSARNKTEGKCGISLQSQVRETDPLISEWYRKKSGKNSVFGNELLN